MRRDQRRRGRAAAGAYHHGMASDPRPGFRARIQQLQLAFANTRRTDPRLVPYMAGVAAIALLLCVGAGALAGQVWIGVVFGVLLAVGAALLVFGQRASSAAIGSIEGQPGAAAAVLQSQRRGWQVTPAVAFTRKQDFVHRAIGRPGVVLVGEGAPARVTSLLKQEKRRVARVVGETPIHEVSIGAGEGQVALRDLQLHLTRLPKALKGPEISALATRLDALGTSEPPLPKGPMPRAPRRR